MLTGHHFNRETGDRPIYVLIDATASNQNIKTLAGNPSGVVVVICTIASGVWVYATNVATPALRTGGFAAGSIVKLINHGHVAGAGGTGGNGGEGGVIAKTAGFPGSPGGPAIYLDDDLIIDNGDGYIFGGGGGAGGGGADYANPGDPWYYGGGGGGGGGLGRNNGDRGYGGIANDGATAPGTDGSDSDWTTGSPGNPGAPGTWPANPAYQGWGGIGGWWGSNGQDGYAGGFLSGGSGGAAGKAVNRNGKTVTWVAGNTGDRVKGAVA